MIESLTLKFTENADISFGSNEVTILVGPNNSGKSLFLGEIERVASDQIGLKQTSIFSDFEVDWPDSKRAVQAALKYQVDGAPINRGDDVISLGAVRSAGSLQKANLDKQQIRIQATSRTDKLWWLHFVARWGIVRLDLKSRLALINPQSITSLSVPENHFFDVVYRNSKVKDRIKSEINSVFDLHFILEPVTQPSALSIRLSTTDPGELEYAYSPEAQKFLLKAMRIEEASDGVQAYTGLVIASFLPRVHTLLIDEPEAFLHPPLARRLGKLLSDLSCERNTTLVAATHSAEFLMGCLQSHAKINVVRMEYSKGKSRGKIVNNEELKTFIRRPLMRSANVIAGLFHDGLVVTESENDRAFYSEIYHRLGEETDGLPYLHFVNVQNKQTIREVLGPMRKFGVPTVAIPDVDIVKDGGSTWTKWLEAAQLPRTSYNSLQTERNAVKIAFDKCGGDMARDGGVNLLAGEDKRAANDLFDRLEDYGVFVVRHGELESWLPHLKVPSSKHEWTIKMLERLGDDPQSSDYVRPADGDVWGFMRAIARWVSDPARKGMHS